MEWNEFQSFSDSVGQTYYHQHPLQLRVDIYPHRVRVYKNDAEICKLV